MNTASNTTSFLTRLIAAFALSFVLALSAGTSFARASDDLAATTSVDMTAQANSNGNGLTSGHTYVIYSKVGSDKTLDVSGGSSANAANVQSYSFNRTVAQQWRYSVDANGIATFTCVGSGKVLDVSGGQSADGTNVWQYVSNGTKAQQWIVTKNSDGTYKIASCIDTSKALDVSGASRADGANIQIFSDNGTNAQKWTFFDVTAMRSEIDAKAKANAQTVSAGTYCVESNINKKMVLDVSGGSSADGANAQLYRWNGTAAQKWTVSYDSTGYATIKNASGKVLDVSGAGVQLGTNVHQYSSNSTLAQKWIIIANSDGTFTIQSALWSDLVLDVSAGSSNNGTNIQIYSSNSTNAQKWIFADPASAPVVISQTIRNTYSGISLDGMTALGIDVSYWNGTIDWNQVAASGIDFAIIRCGYGSDYTSQDDAKFFEYVQGARNAGLDIGVYLYSYAKNSSMASSEADHTLRLLRAAGLSPSDLKYGVYYDLEESFHQSISLEPLCSTYCGKLQAAGYSAGIYSSLSWWNSNLSAPVFGSWNRWVAQWPAKTGNRKCDYTGRYEIWQCMSDGVVPGIAGRVDMDIAY